MALLVGLVTGGFVARLSLELTGRPWPRPLILALGVLLASTGASMARHWALRGRDVKRHHWWPLLLLAVYVVWPQRQPGVAVLLLMLVGLTSLLECGRIQFPNLSISRLIDFLTFALSLSIYTITTAPDVLPADSGEFQIVAPLLGVAHPPGYPLYTILGWLFTRVIPLGNEAYRLNLFSAFLAAGTLTLLGAATRRWAWRFIYRDEQCHTSTPPLAAQVAGLAAALTLGTATTFWAQATVANVRMPTMFAAALGLYALALYSDGTQRRQAARALVLLAVALGLGIGHHPSLVFLGIFFLVYLALVDPRLLIQPRGWWKPLLVVLVTFLPLLYLPLRGAANAPLAPSNLDTRDGFVQHVTAQGFEGDMFAFANARDLPLRLILLPSLFRLQFHPVLLLAAAWGVLLLLWRDRRLLALLFGGLALHIFVSITYRAPQTVEYMMPAYMPIAVLVGLSTAWLLARFNLIPLFSSLATLAAAIILVAGLYNGLEHGPSFFTLAGDRSVRTGVAPILDRAPPGALVLADWRWATPLWYLQQVEGRRPDVAVHYVYPVPGQEYPDTWRDWIKATGGDRPLVLTHFYDLSEYSLEPLGRGFVAHERPLIELPDSSKEGLELMAQNVVFGHPDHGVQLLGYRLSHLQPGPGQTVELTLAWQTIGELASPPSFSAKLVDEGGRQLAQTDRYLGADFTPGEIRFERLVLPLYPDILPGDYPLTLEVYNVGESGFETWPLQGGGVRLDLATLSIHADLTRPLSLQPLDIPFANGLTLLGVDYDRSVPNALRVYVHWRGPAQGGEQVSVEGVQTNMPVLQQGAFQTLVIDLLGEIQGRPQLALTSVDGRAIEAAGPWGWPLQEVSLPAPGSNARFVLLSDEMALIGLSPDGNALAVPGERLLIRPEFIALKPLVNDNATSVRLLDGTGRWVDKHDIQPGLGAIPTLKWIRGVRITDPHPLTVPVDISGDVVRATLVVYENFRGESLTPLDGRMEQTPLGEWKISKP